jgi:hypothetical protein
MNKYSYEYVTEENTTASTATQVIKSIMKGRKKIKMEFLFFIISAT